MEFRRILLLADGPRGESGPIGPAIRGLRARWPEARIELLLPGEREESLSAADERADAVVRWRAGVLATAREVRRRRFDLAVVLETSARGALVPFLGGVSFRIGPGGRLGRILFNMAIPFAPTEDGVVRLRRLLATLDPHADPPCVDD